MNVNSSRQPAGVPSGGQFAANSHTETDVTLAAASSEPVHGTSLVDDGVRIDWDDLGEGLDGDYDPDDPEDVELLRFSIYRADPTNPDGSGWAAVDDASWCTEIPVSTSAEDRHLMLVDMMATVGPRVRSGTDEDESYVRGIAESWSRLDTGDVAALNPANWSQPPTS